MNPKGSIYSRTQADLTYNSNHIEGSRLTREQTRYIFETNTIGITDAAVNVDDITETINYYRSLREWPHEKGWLTDTCLTAQEQYKSLLDYFRIKY